MNKNKVKLNKRMRRRKKIRAKVIGTEKMPRFSVFRSLRGISVQLIDDENAKTLVSVNSREIKDKGTKVEIAQKVGELLAKKAFEKKIKKAVFDRGGYKYHGRVKALAEGARKGGLKF